MGEIGFDEIEQLKFRKQLIKEHKKHYIDKIDDRKILKLGMTDKIAKYVPTQKEKSLKHTKNGKTRHNRDIQQIVLVDGENFQFQEQNSTTHQAKKSMTLNMNQLTDE